MPTVKDFVFSNLGFIAEGVAEISLAWSFVGLGAQG